MACDLTVVTNEPSECGEVQKHGNKLHSLDGSSKQVQTSCTLYHSVMLNSFPAARWGGVQLLRLVQGQPALHPVCLMLSHVLLLARTDISMKRSFFYQFLVCDV